MGNMKSYEYVRVSGSAEGFIIRITVARRVLILVRLWQLFIRRAKDLKKILDQCNLAGLLTLFNYRFDMMVSWDYHRIVLSHQFLNLLRSCILLVYSFLPKVKALLKFILHLRSCNFRHQRFGQEIESDRVVKLPLLQSIQNRK